MESAQPARESNASQDSARESRGPAAILRMRFWAYGGSREKLADLAWTQDQVVAELVRNVISESHGTVVEEQQNTAVAHFSDPLHALAAAKSLQLRLLTLQRDPAAGQPVAAIVVSGESASAGASATPDPKVITSSQQMLGEASTAQILVSEAIYEFARNVTGFDFSAKPVREASDTGASDAIYELRWTDESTYGHLRKTSQNAAPEAAQTRRYKIESELGRGCMGVVYKAYDQIIGRSVALKTIAVSCSFPNRDVLIERLKQEAKAVGSLDHPNIITIYDVGQEEEFLYLSMQLIEGKTLAALLAEGTLPELPVLLSYADQICSAVGYAHQKGVIHRDLKPANFMLTDHGNIKVLDFGIAKIEDATLTQAGMIVGTPTYMAPEQARGKKVDQRSDIFSLGSVFYELFSRDKPFKGDITTILYKLIHEDPVPPAVVNPALPAGIDAIIRKALAKNPKDRFQSCEEMRKAFREQARLLKSSVASTGVRAAALAQANTSAQERLVTVKDLLAEAQPRRSYRWLLGLAACIVAAMAGIGAWAFRVKATTGSFPPAVNKVLALLHRAKTDAQTSSQQSAFNSSGVSDPQQHATETSSATSAPAADQQNTSAAPATPQPSATASTQTAAPSADQAKSQTQDSSSDPTPAASESAAQEPGAEPQAVEPNPFEPREQKQKISASPVAKETRVEGFTRRDVPLLLGKADAAAGRGDYALARYEYEIILRLDRRNATARAGLRRVIAAQADQAKH